MAPENDRNHRVRLRYDERPFDGPVGLFAIPLVLEIDPPLAGDVNAVEVRIGRSVAQARLIARRFFDQDGRTDLGFVASSHLRGIAQLWHALHNAHGSDAPVLFLPLENEQQKEAPVGEGYITDADLEATLKEVEQKLNLGVRTQSLNPPIYLKAFWGPRPFGALDAMIARLNQCDIVPDALLDKARQAGAPNNWAVVYPRDLPERDQTLAAMEPLIRHRDGRTFELSHGHDPAAVDYFVAELSRMSVKEDPYYLLALGNFDVLRIRNMPVRLYLIGQGFGRLAQGGEGEDQ